MGLRRSIKLKFHGNIFLVTSSQRFSRGCRRVGEDVTRILVRKMLPWNLSLTGLGLQIAVANQAENNSYHLPYQKEHENGILTHHVLRAILKQDLKADNRYQM